MAPERCVFGIMLDVSSFLGNISHLFVTNVALNSRTLTWRLVYVAQVVKYNNV